MVKKVIISICQIQLILKQQLMGLLTLIHRSDTKQALPVMNWLISKQNSKGGFSSTQDTILALQALSQIASKMNSSHNSISCKIKFGYYKKQLLPKLVKANRSSNSSEINGKSNDQIEVRLDAKSLELDQFELSETDILYTEHSAEKNELLFKTNNNEKQQLYKNRRLIERLPDYVEIEAKGNGTAVVQVSWQYNLNTNAEESPFYIDAKINSTSVDQINLNICS